MGHLVPPDPHNGRLSTPWFRCNSSVSWSDIRTCFWARKEYGLWFLRRFKRSQLSLLVSSASGSGGEVTTIHASPDTTIGEFKGLVLQTLRPDDDELTRKVSVVELIFGETSLPEDSDSLTLAESGVSPDAAVLAICSKRSVECCREEESSYDLHLPQRAVMLNIPDGTLEIEDFAFGHCPALVGLTISNSVTRIGTAAFASCRSLLNLTIPESVTTIEAGAFNGCSSLTRLSIPESLHEIGFGAFSGCSSLTSLTIPESVASIGAEAFSGCSSLTSLTIPESATEIGEKAFSGCSSLTSLTLPGSVGKIGSDAFAGCASLASLTISGAATHPVLRKLSACSSLADLKSAESTLWEVFLQGCPLECRVVQR